MRRLEVSGRADGQGGLSARTVRYAYTILRAALGDAVKEGRLSVNPTDRSTPPSPSEARPPEMQAWTAAELSRFLAWADAQDPDLSMGWRLLAATGMRRGEALALRWRDVDLDAGRLAMRRSVGVVKTKGAGERLVEGPTKTGRSRVVDLDAGTVAALRAYGAARGGLALDLVRDSALVRSNLDGTHRHPERFSRRFAGQVAQARKALGEERLPVIRLHDLRHTHATLLLADGVPVKVVLSASATRAPPSRSPSTSTSTPAWAARRPIASPRCSKADLRREVSRGYHQALGGPYSKTPRAPELQEHRGEVVSEGGLEPPRPIKGTSTSS